MSSTSDLTSNKNIGNAFEVVSQTYQSLEKLFAALDEEAREKGYLSLVNSAPYFLRWRSDQFSSGWLIGSAIKLYQHNTDPELEGGWKSGPLFLIEVHLLNDKAQNSIGPEIITAQFTYENIENVFQKLLGMTDHWKFYDPLRVLPTHLEEGQEKFPQFHSVNLDPKYGNLQKICFKRRPLASINWENYKDLIEDFGEFRGMKQ